MNPFATLRRVVRLGIEQARVIKQLCVPDPDYVSQRKREQESEVASQRWEEQHGGEP